MPGESFAGGDIPKIDEIVNSIAGKFKTQDAIQSAAYKEIIQYYTFHGAKLKLHELVKEREATIRET